MWNKSESLSTPPHTHRALVKSGKERDVKNDLICISKEAETIAVTPLPRLYSSYFIQTLILVATSKPRTDWIVDHDMLLLLLPLPLPLPLIALFTLLLLILFIAISNLL